MKSSIIVSIVALSCVEAFAPSATGPSATFSTALNMCPGGWGIGTPIDMQEEEFSKGSGARRRRRKPNSTSGESSSFDEVAYSAESAERAANKYALEDPMEFSQRVRQEKDNLQMQKKKDLLEIAKIAGLGDRLKPKVNQEQEGYGKFDDEFPEDDDALDVRVY